MEDEVFYENPENMVEVVSSRKNDKDSKLNDDPINMEKPAEFAGLSKKELMTYLKDPYWVMLRVIFLLLFLSLWVAMLVVAIVVLILTPKCPAQPDQPWWQEGMVYCVHTKSFLDSNDDGVGDLNGIKSKLDYIGDVVKADTISLGALQIEGNSSAVLYATNTNFTSISPEFGSMEDFKALVKAVHKRGMKLILELLPFSTTTNHPWYIQSTGKSNPYYYVDKGTNQNPSNNNAGASTGYIMNDKHLVVNLQNPDVVNEISEAIKYWLGLKVDGIKIVKDQGVLNLYSSDKIQAKKGTYIEFYESLADSWNGAVQQFMDDSPKTLDSKERVLMADFQEPPFRSANLTLWKTYQPINNCLLDIDQKCTTSCVMDRISIWLKAVSKESILSNWRLSSAGSSRIASRIKHHNAFTLLSLTLPGSVHALYGDEILMTDAQLVNTQDSFATSIMHWTSEEHDGFSKVTPWQPAIANYQARSVQAQQAIGAGMSHLNIWSSIVMLRSNPSIAWGDMNLARSREIFYFVRKAVGHPEIMAIFNFGSVFDTLHLKQGQLAEFITCDKAQVISSTYNFEPQQIGFTVGADLDLQRPFLLEPGQGLLLKGIVEETWYS